jgi:hypothetical protein
MLYRGLMCLLLTGFALGQAPNSNPQNAPAPGAPAPAAPTQSAPPPAASVAPDAAVITIQGMCDSGDKTSPDCKTIITKAQFDHIVETVAPKLPQTARRQFATRYANALIMSTEAEKEGIDKTPKFEELLRLTRMQLLQQQLGQSVQEKAGQVSDQEILDYYNSNKDAYEEADLLKVYIPRSKEPIAGAPKLSEEAQKKHDELSEAAMKKEADLIHAQAIAGTDFTKLQESAYLAARMKMKTPSTKLDHTRRNMLPPDQVPVFDLKPGEVSAVIEDQNGFVIYKMVSKDTLPIEKVNDEIKNTVRGKKMQEGMQAVEKSATPTLNDAYFGVAQATPPGMGMGMPMGQGRPQLAPPPTHKK